MQTRIDFLWEIWYDNGRKAKEEMPMGYAFISYSTKNQSDADALKQLLERQGIRTWMAPGDIPAGSKYAQVINQAIKECACFLLLLTDAAQSSVWVSKEVERAVHYGKTILPLKMEELVLNDEFEFYISTDQIVAVQRIDEKAESLQKVLTVVRALTAQTHEPAEETPSAPAQAEPVRPPKAAPAPQAEPPAVTPPLSSEPAAPTDGKPQDSPVGFWARMAERNARAFTFITLSELVLYCLGLIAYIAFLLIDPEFALPALLIGVLAGIVSGTVQRKILHKPLFPSPLRINQINTLLFFIYSVVISYDWGSDREFYDLFDGWDQISTVPCHEISNTSSQTFGITGIVLFGLLWLLGRGVTTRQGPWYIVVLLDISAYSTLVLFNFYYKSANITRHYFPTIHDPTAETVFQVLGLIFGVFCLLMSAIYLIVMLSSKKK
jgi:hypothetical protein